MEDEKSTSQENVELQELEKIKSTFSNICESTVDWDQLDDNEDAEDDENSTKSKLNEIEENATYNFPDDLKRDSSIKAIEEFITYWIRSYLTPENIHQTQSVIEKLLRFQNDAEIRDFRRLTDEIQETTKQFMVSLNSKLANYQCFHGIRDETQFVRILKAELTGLQDDIDLRQLETSFGRNQFQAIFKTLADLACRKIMKIYLEDNKNIIQMEKSLANEAKEKLVDIFEERRQSCPEGTRGTSELCRRAFKISLDSSDRINEIATVSLQQFEDELKIQVEKTLSEQKKANQPEKSKPKPKILHNLHMPLNKRHSMPVDSKKSWLMANGDLDEDSKVSTNSPPLPPHVQNWEKNFQQMRNKYHRISEADYREEQVATDHDHEIEETPEFERQSSFSSSLIFHLDYRSGQVTTAIIKDQNWKILENRDGEKSIPALIAWSSKSGKFCFGKEAAHLKSKSEERQNFKIWRLQELTRDSTFGRDPFKQKAVRLFFQYLRSQAETSQQMSYEEAIVILPDWLNTENDVFLKYEIKEAGFNMVSLQSESIAVAAAYFEKRTLKQTFLESGVTPLIIFSENCGFIQVKIVSLDISCKRQSCSIKRLGFGTGFQNTEYSWMWSTLIRVFQYALGYHEPSDNFSSTKEIFEKAMENFRMTCTKIPEFEHWVNSKMDFVVITENEQWRSRVEQLVHGEEIAKLKRKRLDWRKLMETGAILDCFDGDKRREKICKHSKMLGKVSLNSNHSIK